MKNLGYLIVAVAMIGCGADATTPTVSGVFPSEAFIGRDARVEVSGDATNWKDGATVSFGSNVMVKSVTVASPTSLFADITVMDTATVGAQDVVVTDSGKSFTLSQAFELKAPVALTFDGDVAQGGLPFFTINNLDFDNKFDATTDANGAFSNIQITGPDGVDFEISSVTDFEITGRAFIDGNAAASGAVSVASGPAGSQINSIIADNVTVTARAGDALAANTPVSGTISGPGGSVLYTITASGANALVHFTLSTTDQNAQLASEILGPPNGSWSGALGGQHAFMTTGTTVQAVVADLGEYGGYQFTIQGAGETVTTAAEGSDTSNGVFATAPAATAMPFGQIANVMSAAADVDMIKVTISAADANKRIHIITDVGGDPNTDTAVDVVDAAGTSFMQDFTGGFGGPVDGTECSFFGCLPGDPLGEDAVSDQLPAGTYAVKITAGAAFATTNKNYGVVIWLE